MTVDPPVSGIETPTVTVVFEDETAMAGAEGVVAGVA